MFNESISYSAALFAGLLSFFSPCILPLIPAYFTFITGLSLDELTGARTTGVRAQVIRATLSYVLGFSLVFVLMGASASFIGGAIFQYRDWIRIIGGILIILLGIHMTGLIRFRSLEFERRLQVQKKPLHLLGTFCVGIAFGAVLGLAWLAGLLLRLGLAAAALAWLGRAALPRGRVAPRGRPGPAELGSGFYPGNAGAWVGPETLARAAALQLDPRAFEAANDSGAFFAALGQAVVTGPTRTNVNDFRAILIAPAV